MLLTDARVGEALVDLAIEGGAIAAILPAGSDRSGQELVALDGRRVIPGLWDNHVHIGQWALTASRLDVSGCTSAAQVAAVIRDSGRTESPLVAVGFRDALWPDRPSTALLDGIGPGPVAVVSGDLHAVWLNTAAVALYGVRDAPDGVVREDEAFRVIALIDTVADTRLDGWVEHTARAAAARGVVGIVDYEMSDNHAAWLRRRASGFGALRVEFGIYAEHLDDAIARGLRTGAAVDELVTVGGLKVLTDGSLNTRTAYTFDDYPGLEHTERPHGLLTVPPSELLPLLRRATAAGILPAVHAIGDQANSLALDAFEELGCGGRIEHAQLLTEGDIARFARLGVAASVQPDHAMDDRDVAERYWPGRTARAFPLRALLDAGARLLFGSDAPVSPLDPWLAIAAAVTRTRGAREPWHPEQAITLDEAIHASTRSSLAVGQVADLAILDDDPFASPTELRATAVGATLVAGRFTHRAL
ncbi:amidohydrolase [Galbitalea soli]|uniref:Amidohydrolase family protein n=1 Tax=Galbitalea soli TaxID=1268042 RepID=A0A7C9PNS2_9MICO|nr:amidohydrolase family protein [Galbitalea soli]NEM91686.1 amidohydrolase family protein [Galbitalea soli]NYJ30382.1 hypothetical protein [Galbitalea soli]